MARKHNVKLTVGSMFVIVDALNCAARREREVKGKNWQHNAALIEGVRNQLYAVMDLDTDDTTVPYALGE